MNKNKMIIFEFYLCEDVWEFSLGEIPNCGNLDQKVGTVWVLKYTAKLSLKMDILICT